MLRHPSHAAMMEWQGHDLELGVGMMTPMFIKEPFMNMVYQWPHALYVPINPLREMVASVTFV